MLGDLSPESDLMPFETTPIQFYLKPPTAALGVLAMAQQASSARARSASKVRDKSVEKPYQ